jgi:hypothetical protein
VRRAQWALVIALVAGCANTSATKVRGPDGKVGWVVITCKGSHAPCYERASTECPEGYDVKDKDGTSGQYLDYNSGFVVPTYTGELLIKCH